MIQRDAPTREGMLDHHDSQRQTQAERRETAERAILQAAEKIVAERGLEELSMTEVGEAAGYSRALPGHYFGSKSALIHALTNDTHAAATTARGTLARLSDVVIRAGVTDGVVLTCVLGRRDGSARPLNHAVTAREAALALTTAVCVRPPTVMWGIEPSLDGLTVDGELRVRWLHRGRASHVARTAWESMTGVTFADAAHA